MLINCTNHPYEIWNVKQREAAKEYDHVVDLPFPAIEPDDSSDRLRELVEAFAGQIEMMHPDAVLVAGEYLFTFMLVDRLLMKGTYVVCSRSRRITKEIKKEDGTNEKTAIFDFEGFYPYEYYDSERRHR